MLKSARRDLSAGKEVSGDTVKPVCGALLCGLSRNPWQNGLPCWANTRLAWELLLAATRDWRDSRGGEGTEKTFAGYTIKGHCVVNGRRVH